MNINWDHMYYGQCELCGSLYKSFESDQIDAWFYMHMLSVHPQPSIKKYWVWRCQVCGAEVPTFKERLEHNKVHKK